MGNPFWRHSNASRRAALGIVLLVLAGCAGLPPSGPTPPAPAGKPRPIFEAVPIGQLPGWDQDDLSQAWPAFMRSCGALASRNDWRAVCAAAEEQADHSKSAIRSFFETHFKAYRIHYADGNETGLLTGYYEPILPGSRERDATYRYPLYAIPDDLVDVQLSGEYPELARMRLRGRLEGRTLVPYPARADLADAPGLRGKELVWLNDRMTAFFAEVQGSCRVELVDSPLPHQMVRLTYADQNGHPYRAIGRWLVDQGEMKIDQVSMQSIIAWAREHPDRTTALINFNPSFVFFREVPIPDPVLGPPGALGVALTPGRSIAIDAHAMPLGAPVFIDTVLPGHTAPLQRLVLGQDTGGAIAITASQPVRADLFLGSGDEAGELAGRMRQPLRAWLLLPRSMAPPDTD